ncbi:MAG: hypothetical protein ACI9Y1_000097 [Lentisphaeria bacterium]|jgi:hypothetical protein
MVAVLTKHDTKWVSPSPLWKNFSDTSTSDVRKNFHRPTILRFNSDNFMEELLGVMNYYPETLGEWKAQPETWREPMDTPSTAALIKVARPLSQFKKIQTQQLKTLKPSVIKPSTAANTSLQIPVNTKPLKLYQPAQLRFYLVTASFVCRQVGLPDRKVDFGKQQKVKFVMRRLLPKDISQRVDPELCDIDQCDEYALLLTDEGKQWQKVGAASSVGNAVLLDDEERLPMFNVGYQEDGDKRRRMLAGYIPVAQREAYLNTDISEGGEQEVDGALLSVATGLTEQEIKAANALETKRDAIAHLFNMQVAGPWKRLISQAFNDIGQSDDWAANPPPMVDDLGAPPLTDNSKINNLKIAREKIQTTSWYILVDLAQLLKDYVPNVYSYIQSAVEPSTITAEESELYDALAAITLNHTDYQNEFPEAHYNYLDDAYHSNGQLYASLTSALNYLMDNPAVETELDLVDYFYDREVENIAAEHAWPSFLFPLADPLHAAPLPNLFIANPSDAEPDISHDQLDALMALVRAAIPSDLQKSAPDVSVNKAPRQSNSLGWFVIRCVFESPNCGPIHPAIVSETTEAFQMASFFDPDAPGRPIKIPMPMDISPAGLRKFNKNATFMISDMLCGKIRGTRKTTLGDLVLSVLPWPFHKDLPDPGKTGPCTKGGTSWGMFCSFSIPIVTLCAMILLIIMVTLFDIFFRWLPLLFVCLPIPGLKGKK